MKRVFSFLLLALTVSFCLPGMAQAPKPNEAKESNSSAEENVKPFTLFGVAGNTSSMGVGVQFGTALSRRTNLRFGVNAGSYDHGFKKDGIHYDGKLGFTSLQALVDFFPFGGSHGGFHLSPGMLIYNGNELTAKVSVPGGSRFDLGGATYYSSANTPITGTGKLSVNKAAPMVLFGFGNLVPRSRHISFNVDAGVAFHGTPKANLTLAGNACDAGGVNCRNIATDATAQSNLRAEVAKLNRIAEPYKVYPVISLGVGYRF